MQQQPQPTRSSLFWFVLLWWTLAVSLVIVGSPFLVLDAHATEDSSTRTVEQQQQQPPDRRPLERQPGERHLLRHHTHKPWLQEHFPSNPAQDGKVCRATTSHRICDPDQILTEAALQKVDAYLKEPKYSNHADLCRPFGSTNEKEEEKDHVMDETNRDERNKGMEIQMGVALVKQVRVIYFLRELRLRGGSSFVFLHAESVLYTPP